MKNSLKTTGIVNTIPELLERSAAQYPDTRALFAPHAKPILELTYAQLVQAVKEFGAGLLKAGIKPGQHVALFSDNSPRWLIASLALNSVGAVDVPRGSDTAESEFEFILEHSGSIAAIIQNKRLFDRLAAGRTFRSLKTVILMDDTQPSFGEQEAEAEVLPFNALADAGRDHLSLFADARAGVTGDTLAALVYTSGTTGSPKGVMLSHRALMTQPNFVNLGLRPLPGEIQLSILPSWHAYERATEYFGIYYGTTLTYSDKKYIKDDLLKLCPHLLPCVPRIWEMVYKGIYTKLQSASPGKQKLFKCFTDVGLRYIVARRVVHGLTKEKVAPSPLARFSALLTMVVLWPIYKMGDAIVFSKLRAVTGGRMKAAVSGGGSLAPYLDDFFELAGIPILNGYGLTETSPVISVRRVDHNVRGSVGQPIEQTEISIRSTNGEALGQGVAGEIWVRGPQVMLGYYNNPEATSKVLKDDGWFITGDLGYFNPRGDLVISGRAKDTIVLLSGENVEPEPIEDACRKSALVQQIVVVGQDQKLLGALVVPEFSALAEELGMSSDATPTEIIAHADAAKVVRQSLAEVMQADGRFKAAESVGKIHLLTESFSEKNDMLTNTMKIKRNVVLKHYAQQIKELFA